MSARKRTYPCGHRGKGAFCHRCVEEARRRDEARRAKAQRAERLEQAPVALDRLPAEVADKALDLIASLRDGASYVDFHGKRFTNIGQRDVVSIPIGRRYRLVCRDSGGVLEFLEALSHEDYNTRLASGGWPR